MVTQNIDYKKYVQLLEHQFTNNKLTFSANTATILNDYRYVDKVVSKLHRFCLKYFTVDFQGKLYKNSKLHGFDLSEIVKVLAYTEV